MRLTILDRISPDEIHLPPSARTWARLISIPSCSSGILELRDPNSGQSSDPATKPRHQYLVARERLWRRVLLPAALDATDDSDLGEVRWRLAQPGCGLLWEWAREEGVPLLGYATTPERVAGEWRITPGRASKVGYSMPAADPYDQWSDVTGVQCPLCDQTLHWHEAGYVPGYRACMREGDVDSLRHRWLWTGDVLVLDANDH
ncbi:MAG: hypothetical protein OXU20_06955 [Myxococcales bacterium]|nr:hypothetical protein [Myxococcales bacterium]MDD9965621.1 hypothetical protein [Myxococcales bacterium]